MPRLTFPSRPSAQPPARSGDRGAASSLLLLAMGATAGIALVLGVRRVLTTPRAARVDRLPRPNRDQRRLAVPPSQVTASELERRVLEAFRNDPILRQRSIDIGATGSACIELTGWVDGPQEVAYARTLARGVPGVRRVIDQLAVPQTPTVRAPRAD